MEAHSYILAALWSGLRSSWTRLGFLYDGNRSTQVYERRLEIFNRRCELNLKYLEKLFFVLCRTVSSRPCHTL